MTFSTLARSSAFSLVEVVIALGVMSFCIVALLGLFSVGLVDSRVSARELQAAHITESLLCIRRISPTNNITGCPLPVLNASSQSSTPVLLDENGKSATGYRAVYGLIYRIVAPTSSSESTFIYLSLQWPANAPTGHAEGRYEVATRITTK